MQARVNRKSARRHVLGWFRGARLEKCSDERGRPAFRVVHPDMPCLGEGKSKQRRVECLWSNRPIVEAS